jgi:hypothetical protein
MPQVRCIARIHCNSHGFCVNWAMVISHFILEGIDALWKTLERASRRDCPFAA